MKQYSEEVVEKAKQIAPLFWPSDCWSVDISCKQGQHRTLEQARNLLEGNDNEDY